MRVGPMPSLLWVQSSSEIFKISWFDLGIREFSERDTGKQSVMNTGWEFVPIDSNWGEEDGGPANSGMKRG